ncbi:MAG: hypothetical protein ACOX4F_00530 [Atopobiaceae bacterium]
MTKKVSAKTSKGSSTSSTNPTYVAATDTVEWTVEARNDGVATIENYVVSDEVSAPYLFTGDLRYSTGGISRNSDNKRTCNRLDAFGLQQIRCGSQPKNQLRQFILGCVEREK